MLTEHNLYSLLLSLLGRCPCATELPVEGNHVSALWQIDLFYSLRSCSDFSCYQEMLVLCRIHNMQSCGKFTNIYKCKGILGVKPTNIVTVPPSLVPG